MSNTTVKVSRKQAASIIKATFPAYRGRKIVVEFAPTHTFSDTCWSGGTKRDYASIRSNGAVALMGTPSAFSNPIEGATVAIPEDVLIVTHSFFCGTDMGLRIYAHPAHLPKWLKGN